MIKKFLETGRIVGTHGIKGEVRVEPWCDGPEFLKEFEKMYLSEDGCKFIDISSVKPHKNIAIIKISGCDSIEQAESFRGKILYINRNDVKLEKGSYFIEDIIGCKVYHYETNEYIGDITDVSKTGANDVWHIESKGKEYLIPVIDDVLKECDVENKVVKIVPIPGVLDDED